MKIRRIVPDIRSDKMKESRAFYVDFLGLTIGMDMEPTFRQPTPKIEIGVNHLWKMLSLAPTRFKRIRFRGPEEVRAHG